MRKVGFALLPKKVDRVLTPELRALAAAQGLELLHVDPSSALKECGSLDAIVQKIPNNAQWEAALREYITATPSCIVVDAPASVQPLRNRETQLDVLRGQELLLQVTVRPGDSQNEATEKLHAAGLKLPVALKSLAPEGHPAAHQVGVLRTGQQLADALEALQFPAILQEFIPHVPIVFKVYVLGPHVHVDIRHTLPQAAEASASIPLQPPPTRSLRTPPQATPAPSASATPTSPTTSPAPTHTHTPTPAPPERAGPPPPPCSPAPRTSVPLPLPSATARAALSATAATAVVLTPPGLLDPSSALQHTAPAPAVAAVPAAAHQATAPAPAVPAVPAAAHQATASPLSSQEAAQLLQSIQQRTAVQPSAPAAASVPLLASGTHALHSSCPEAAPGSRQGGGSSEGAAPNSSRATPSGTQVGTGNGSSSTVVAPSSTDGNGSGPKVAAPGGPQAGTDMGSSSTVVAPSSTDGNGRGRKAAAPGGPQDSLQQMVPAWATRSIAQHLRAALGLHLFNFDLLLPCTQQLDSSCLQLCVVDINYFPGYDKIPGWEGMMVDFLRGLLGRSSG